LAATLRKVTEALAHELACPAQIAPDWSEFEWIVARAVAAMHGVSPLLAHTLRWQGPAGWVQFLEEQRAHTTKRQIRIAELVRLIDKRSREAGVACVALKGVALHEMDLYTIGERPMADIDLLVRPVDAERTAWMLEGLGFQEASVSWKERGFSPVDGHIPSDLGEHSNNDLKIELHERICERLPWRITDVSEVIFPGLRHAGLNAYPSKAALLTHLLLHAAGSMAYKSLRFLNLEDLARLSSAMASEDWNEFLKARRNPGGLWWAFPPLRLASRYFPTKIPGGVLAATADDCPYLLERASRHRSLYDVSLSYPWVNAFPGIEWAQSLREMLGYTASRVWPSREHIASRAIAAKSEAWASDGQWPRLSQVRRILRWLTSSPVRPTTMHGVSAALAEAQIPH